MGVSGSVCVPLNGTILESVLEEPRGERVLTLLPALLGAVLTSWRRQCWCPAPSLGGSL